PLEAGVAVDGHPENAAASVFGGLVAATTVGGRPVVRRLALDPHLRFVLAVPDRPLATLEARAALPGRVDRRDAVFNLGRMGLLIAGLADHRELVAAAAEDRLHQDARTPLFPESPVILAGLVAAGAAAACWSGAGPSLLALCAPAAAAAVAAAAVGLLAEGGIPGRVVTAEPDLAGVTVIGAPAG
ncbi:MAG: homoserine kinase, partial [Acidimicrobiales bacterium]